MEKSIEPPSPDSDPFVEMPSGDEFRYATEQDNLEEYHEWIKNLGEARKDEYLKNISVTWDVFLEGLKYVRVRTVITVAKRWMIPWQILASAVDSGAIKVEFSCYGLKFNKSNNSSRIEKMILGIPEEEIIRIEEKYPRLKASSKRSERARQWERERKIKLELKEKETRISELEGEIEGLKHFASSNTDITEPKTAAATIAKLKKKNLALEDGYEGVAKLACELFKRGPRSGGPWSEDELLGLANELGVTLKGRCLKAFKKGMPSYLIKKEPGARPTHIGENTSKT